jgi:hypothetical protein
MSVGELLSWMFIVVPWRMSCRMPSQELYQLL